MIHVLFKNCSLENTKSRLYRYVLQVVPWIWHCLMVTIPPDIRWRRNRFSTSSKWFFISYVRIKNTLSNLQVFFSTLNVFVKQIIGPWVTTKNEITFVPIFSPRRAIKDEDKVHSLSFCIFHRTSVTRKTTLIKFVKDGLQVPDPEKMPTRTLTKSTLTKLLFLI